MPGKSTYNYRMPAPPPSSPAQRDRIFPTIPGRLRPDPPCFAFLLRYGWHLLGQAFRRANPGANPDCRADMPLSPALRRRLHANPVRLATRLARACAWARALSRTLAGSQEFLHPLGRPRPARIQPATPARPPSAGGRPTRAWRDPDLADHARMLHAFQTHSIARITRRLCRAFSIGKGHEYWPDYLLECTETPAECAARHYGPPAPVPASPRRPRARLTPAPHAPHAMPPPPAKRVLTRFVPNRPVPS